MNVKQLREENARHSKRMISSGIESFRKVILSYSKDRKQSNIIKYIVDFEGDLYFHYLFRNDKARESTINMIDSLKDKQKISSSEKKSLEKLTTDCYNGQDIRAQVRGERYAQKIRALTLYTDKIMSI